MPLCGRECGRKFAHTNLAQARMGFIALLAIASAAFIMQSALQLRTSATAFRALFASIPGVDASIVPSIVVAGTAKAGTSDVVRLLIDMSRGRVAEPVHKELYNLFSQPTMEYCDGAFIEYLRKLRHACDSVISYEDCHQCLKRRNISTMTIDGSPEYLHEPAVPVTLGRVSPNTKVIVMLRDPIQRAHSLYNHWQVEEKAFGETSFADCVDIFVRWKESTAAIHAALTDSTAAPEIISAFQKLREAGMRNDRPLIVFSSGYYYASLLSWIEVFDTPGNLMVIDAHEYFACRLCVFEQLSKFVFGRPLNEDERQRIQGAGIENRKISAGIVADAAKLSEETVATLRKHFAPETRKFLELARTMRQRGYDVIGFESAIWKAYI